jgi:hypothetical protein
MDFAIQIPGTRRRFRADSVIGIIPGIGDLMTLGATLYIFAEAHHLGVPNQLRRKMAGNFATDFGLGAIPLSATFLTCSSHQTPGTSDF